MVIWDCIFNILILFVNIIFIYSVKVCIRIRPMMSFEKVRGDYTCIEGGRDNSNVVQLKVPAAGGAESVKDYRFNMCFDENKPQVCN